MTLATNRAERNPPRLAADVARAIRLGGDARALLTPEIKAGDYLRLLVDEGLFIDAVRLMGGALSRQKLVWWTCLCTRHTWPAAPIEAEAIALRAAVQWVLDPTEERAKAANAAVAAAGLKTAAGCAAKSAYLVQAKKAPTAARVAGAGALLAAAKAKASERVAAYQAFVSIGLDVSHGVARWDEPRPPARKA